MKMLGLILSIYFLALNVLPCQDEPVTEDSTQTELVQDQGVGHDHSPCTSDLCSPFCGCHCCHTHSTKFELVGYDPYQPAFPQADFAHFDSAGNDFPHSLFQPPRA
ncbi:DUF6660 family protein [Pricia sp. S334]|uniref:DUF6660 family protein n=1 Tax=Pricia mediterranea TaxID=3076079 RepID=A0ABU3L2P3_9FLAO|nr:DUF6660 family protein [Pricia sp. S334]MDT7827528.1 DUF6660 family protein [Pricia sp. S334]